MKSKREKLDSKSIQIEKGEKGEKGRQTVGWKICGCLLLLAGVITVINGVRYYRMTLGTQLLFVSASAGNMSRYWWIMVIVGIILFVAGFVILRITGKTAAADEMAVDGVPAMGGNPTGNGGQAMSKMQPADETTEVERSFDGTCPACGRKNLLEARFCAYCGKKLRD